MVGDCEQRIYRKESKLVEVEKDGAKEGGRGRERDIDRERESDKKGNETEEKHDKPKYSTQKL